MGCIYLFLSPGAFTQMIFSAGWRPPRSGRPGSLTRRCPEDQCKLTPRAYVAYFTSVPMPARFLHEVLLEQIVMSWLVWAFCHVSMALGHAVTRRSPAGAAPPTQPDTGAS